jgi:hypothetical protein
LQVRLRNLAELKVKLAHAEARALEQKLINENPVLRTVGPVALA